VVILFVVGEELSGLVAHALAARHDEVVVGVVVDAGDEGAVEQAAVSRGGVAEATEK